MTEIKYHGLVDKRITKAYEVKNQRIQFLDYREHDYLGILLMSV